MANDFKIGAGIALDGEKEFRKAISAINKDMAVLGSEMKKVTAQFDGNADSVEALTAKQEVYNKQAEEQRKKIDTIRKALENAKKEFGENSDKVKDWQIKLNNAEAELSKLERTLEDNRKALDKLKPDTLSNSFKRLGDAITSGVNSPFTKAKNAIEAVKHPLDTAKDGFEGLKQKVSTGIQDKLDSLSKKLNGVDDALEDAGEAAKESGKDAEKGESGWSKLGGALSKAGEFAAKAVAALGAAAAAAGSALVGMSVSGAAYADDILTLSVQTGIATDKIQEFKYAAELVDVPLETLTKSMARNIRSMTTAAKGTGDAATAYQKLGIQITDANGNLRDGEEVFWQTIDALGKIENETERDALAMQLFGKSAQELNPLIEAGAATLQDLANQAHEAGYVLSQDTLEAFGAFDDQLQFLKVNAEGAKNALGTILLPMLTDLATEGNSLIKQFTKGIVDANGDISKIGEAIGDALFEATKVLMQRLPEFIQAGLGIVAALVKGIMSNLGDSINYISEWLPDVMEVGRQLLQALMEGLTTDTWYILANVLGVVWQIADAFLEAAPQIIAALAQGLSDAIPRLVPQVVETILILVDTLIDNVDLLVDAAIAIMEALAMGIVEALPIIIEKGPEIIQKLMDAIIRNVPKLIQAAGKIITTLIQGITQNFGKLGETAGKIVTAILNGMSTLTKKIFEVGKDVVKGLWEGIKSMAKWITDQITGFFNGIVGGVKKLLGIKSPSRVFAGIGENMAAGLGLGFDERMAKVTRDMERAIPTDFDVSVGARGRTAGAPLVVQTPVYLDGRLVTASTSIHQSGRNRSYSRAMGVAYA